MKIIVCIDDKNGMMFNHRRQSKDREVRRDMLSYIGQHRLWMNEYSRKQIEVVPKDAQIEVNEILWIFDQLRLRIVSMSLDTDSEYKVFLI